MRSDTSLQGAMTEPTGLIVPVFIGTKSSHNAVPTHYMIAQGFLPSYKRNIVFYHDKVQPTNATLITTSKSPFHSYLHRKTGDINRLIEREKGKRNSSLLDPARMYKKVEDTTGFGYVNLYFCAPNREQLAYCMLYFSLRLQQRIESEIREKRLRDRI